MDCATIAFFLVERRLEIDVRSQRFTSRWLFQSQYSALRKCEQKSRKTNKNLTFFVNVEKTKLPDANSIGTSRRKSVSGFCNSSFFIGYEDFARCADETYKVGDYIVSFL